MLDVKYKDYGGNKVSTSGIFQLTFYALHHHDLTSGDIHRSVIVHPRYFARQHGTETRIEVFPREPFRGFIHVRNLSVEQVLEGVRRRDVEGLRETALRLVRV